MSQQVLCYSTKISLSRYILNDQLHSLYCNAPRNRRVYTDTYIINAREKDVLCFSPFHQQVHPS